MNRKKKQIDKSPQKTSCSSKQNKKSMGKSIKPERIGYRTSSSNTLD